MLKKTYIFIQKHLLKLVALLFAGLIAGIFVENLMELMLVFAVAFNVIIVYGNHKGWWTEL